MIGDTMPRGISVLEEKHVISVLIYLCTHDGCRKSDLYRDVSRNPRLPEKLDILEYNRLIVQEPIRERNSVRIHLTEEGRRVAESLDEISRLFPLYQ